MRNRTAWIGALLLASCGGGASSGGTPALSGWTVFAPQPGARIVHVSSAGDDAWPGTEAAPKRTIAAGYAELRAGEPDWLLLRRGDVFPVAGPLVWGKSGPAGGGWIRLGAYGSESDPRPVIDTGAAAGILITPGFQSAQTLSNIALTDVHLLCSTRRNNPAAATTAPMGIQTVAAGWQGTGAAFSNLLIENVRVEGYALGYAGNRDIENLAIRRCLFHYLFVPDGVGGGAQGVIASPAGWLLEENVFYRIQSPDIPGVVSGAYSVFMHSAYITAEATGVVARGNIVIRATEAFMQRPGGIYSRNVGAHTFNAGLIGQAWGVTPTPGGVTATFEESLLLNAQGPFYLGNTRSGTVRENLFVRDADGSADFPLTLVAQNAQGSGLNIGVHDTTFADNRLCGTIAWDPSDTASFSGLTFAGNQENPGQSGPGMAAYLASIGWAGATVDDWAAQLIARDRANFSADHRSPSIINFHRAQFGLPPLP
jgi:hypothetical protein